MKKAAADPHGRFVRDQSGVKRGLFSLHVRYASVGGRRSVKHPVHIVFFRVVEAGTILIVRILHERMDPALHLAADNGD